eukprot:g2263.t1
MSAQKRKASPDDDDNIDHNGNSTEGFVTKKRIRVPFKVNAKMHKENRERVRARLVAALDDSHGGFIFLQGGSEVPLYDTDTNVNVFQQESNFHYLFGVKEPDCFGAVDIRSGKSFLFVPKLPESYQLWMGSLKTTAWFEEHYEIDCCFYVEDMASSLIRTTSFENDDGSDGAGQEEGTKASEEESIRLFVLRGTNTDSGRDVTEVDESSTFKKAIESTSSASFSTVHDSPSLYDILAECRVIKSSLEIDLMRFVTDVTSDAHMAVLQHCKPSMREYQLESVFRHHCYYYAGCRHVAYTCICASGLNGAVLHYGHAAAPNSRKLDSGDMCLFDMGAEYHRYASDVTCSFPANGVFSRDQRIIYESVLAAQWAVMDNMRPGVSWRDMHDLAYRVICTKLRDDAGVLRKDASIDDMMRENVGSLFMMHGLGHFIGLNVHDVGGYPRVGGQPRPKEPGYRSLRTARVLKKGMCLTVEPGIYFNAYAISTATEKQKSFIVLDRLEDFRSFGGVRIEDVVVVTESGIENLTNCPRTADDIEAVMSGKLRDRKRLVAKYYRKTDEGGAVAFVEAV